MQLWSVVAQDSCLRRLGGLSKKPTLRALADSTVSPPARNQLADAAGHSSSNQAASTALLSVDSPSISPSKLQQSKQLAVVYLNLSGAENVKENHTAFFCIVKLEVR